MYYVTDEPRWIVLNYGLISCSIRHKSGHQAYIYTPMTGCQPKSVNNDVILLWFCVFYFIFLNIDVETLILPEELVVTDVVEVSLLSLCRNLMYILNKCFMRRIKPCFPSVAQTKPLMQR